MDVRQFIVSSGEAGERLDKWLVRKIPELSRNQIKQLLDRGKVLINARRVLIAGWEVEETDEIEIRIIDSSPAVSSDSVATPETGNPPRANFSFSIKERDLPKPRLGHESSRVAKRREAVASTAPASGSPSVSQVHLDIVFEDRDILILNKPYGVLTEPKKDSPHNDLLAMVRQYLREKHGKNSYVKLVHRLDRDTSGILAVAKSKVGEQLESQFRSHTVNRQYVAFLDGRLEQEEGKITFALEKGNFEGGRKVRVMEGEHPGREGMRATTQFRVLERYKNATMVSALVSTGRTHQIRAHFAKLGHPLIGDRVYGKSLIDFSRHALHATVLGFKHPGNKKRLRFEIKLPKDLETLQSRLRGL